MFNWYDWDPDSCGCIAIIVFIAIAIASVIGWTVVDYRNPEVVEGIVVNSYIKRYGDNDYFHHVIQFDNGRQEVFQNRDAYWVGKWNSADIELEIKDGQRYRFEVRGTRWPFFSRFRNIVSATPIE